MLVFSIFHILPKRSILKILKNIFPSIYSIFRHFFPISCCKYVLQLKRLVTSSRHFCFSKFSSQKVTGWKGKNQVTFFVIPFKNNLLSKISYMHWMFWAICQIKKAHGTIFYCRFSAYLFHKSVSYQIPY